MKTDYDRYKANQQKIDALGEHPKARRLVNFIAKIDYKDYDDSLGLSLGGDGDNGEILIEEISKFLYTLEASES